MEISTLRKKHNVTCLNGSNAYRSEKSTFNVRELSSKRKKEDISSPLNIGMPHNLIKNRACRVQFTRERISKYNGAQNTTFFYERCVLCSILFIFFVRKLNLSLYSTSSQSTQMNSKKHTHYT